VAADKLLESAVELLQQRKDSKDGVDIRIDAEKGVSFHPSGRSQQPEAYQIAAKFLNQYLTAADASGSGLLVPLSADLRRILESRLSENQLQWTESQQFTHQDSLHLETCFLTRDVAEHVTAGLRQDLPKAEALFDWLIRNVQLIPVESAPPMRVGPLWTLIMGRGTELERAWTFIELLRQIDVDAILLAHLEGDSYVPWLPAALIDDSLYLFDTTLGLPVPGPDGAAVATLQQAAETPSLLAELDLDAEHPYRVRPEQLSRLVVLYESTPAFWAPRMHFLQDRLGGQNRVVLWSDLDELAKRATAATGREVVQDLWDVPLAVDANTRQNREYALQLQQLLLPYFMIEQASRARRAHLGGQWKIAIPLYMQNRAGPPVPLLEMDQTLRDWVREDSTYFLGLAKYEQREYVAATNFLDTLYLRRYPEGRFTAGARYNLGRCAEAQQDIDQAVALYTVRDTNPQSVGNLIRARRLGWKPEAAERVSSNAAAGK
jgi:hypothetical protein